VTANRSTPRLRLALLGVGGVMLAHFVGYVVAYPDPGRRSIQLAHTGHSYWETAIIVVLFGVLVAVLGELVLSLTRARNRGSVHHQPCGGCGADWLPARSLPSRSLRSQSALFTESMQRRGPSPLSGPPFPCWF
jgi:hypothetical protein